MKKKLFKWLFLLLLISVTGGVIWLAMWDIPAPVSQVEIEIPNDRFENT